MALSRIWSAFILTAIIVACFNMFRSDSSIITNMVTGKADDVVYYKTIGNTNGYENNDAFQKYIGNYGYKLADSATKPAVIITNNLSADSVNILKINNEAAYVYTYDSIKPRLIKKADGIIETCKTAVNICIGLIGIMALFMGFMSIAEKAGGINVLSRIVGPFFSKLFPEVPRNHPATGHMMMNFSANLLGLDNAATPFGLKAMQSLQELNPDKDNASNAQIMFLCLHASGLTLIPVSIIAVRASLGAQNPTEIFIPCMIATFAATIAAMVIVSIKQKINLFQPAIILWVFSITAVITSLIVYVQSLNVAGISSFSSLLSNGIILIIFLLIILGGLYKKINVFDAFVEGAKGGFETSVKIIPYLVGMLVAVSLLRTSGTFDILITGLKNFVSIFGGDTRWVDGMPTALIKPLSGSGARGMMVDTMKTFGPDSFQANLASVLQGSSDTTFYVIAVYFGAVSIRNTRYSVGAMLLADLVGILTAITVCYLFFGSR